MRKLQNIVPIIFIALSVSCKRGTTVPAGLPEPTAPPPESSAQPAPATPSEPARAPALVLPADLSKDAAAALELTNSLAFLNQALRDFIAQYNRMPKDYAEFQRLKLDSPRQPPPGKKWIIDPVGRKIVLADKP